MADRSSQVVIESEVSSNPNSRASQAVVETVVDTVSVSRSSQVSIEAEVKALTNTRCSQYVIEVLLINLEIQMLPIYPQNLPGLTFNVKWTPQFYNMPTQQTTTGADIDLALSDSPTHEFELIYEFLRDSFGRTEFKKMMGFFLRLAGTFGRFLFKNPDDYQQVNSVVGTADGTSFTFGPIKRSFGVGEDIGTEPIGYVDTSSPVKVYVDGVEQSSSQWELLQSTPGDIYVKLYSVPTVGKVITIDCNYFYYCKFVENTMSFEKFMDKIWMLGSVKIKSCRPGA